MHYTVIQRIIGQLLALFSITIIPPLLISFLYHENETKAFLDSYLFLIISGILLWLPVRKVKPDLRLRDGFLVVVLFWFILGASGALPLILYDSLNISISDAAFESVSALTTTGATVLVGLDTLPHSVLFYRQELQWLGGMGIIVLAVAILPMLGIGGMQLYRAETPGPIKDSKLTPRIAETAKTLWYIYVILTLICIAAYWLAGMSLFDAVAHAFATVSTGGLSTHDASIGYFDSVWIETIAIIFMALGGVNFGLHFTALKHRSIRSYFQDTEFRAYILILTTVTFICVSYLLLSGYDNNFFKALRHGLFHTVSILTSTGFSTSEFYIWPGFLPVLLIFASFIGGCAGSTAGGMKIIRILLLLKNGGRELKRLVHPTAVITVKINKRPVSDRVINGVWGFFAAYITVFVVIMLLMMASGVDQVTSFSAVAATMNNLGPGLGQVGANYADMSDFVKWLLCISMLMGRLEIFTLLILFTPGFWRK